MMNIKDQLLVGFVLVFWSLNFVVLKFASQIISLELFNFFRFLIFVPVLFFVKKPKMSFKILILLSICLNFLNFLLMGFALENGLSASQASLISIPRIVFALLIAAIFLSEKLTIRQILGIVFSCAAILYLKYDASNFIFVSGFLYLCFAAFLWACANIYLKKKAISLSVADTIWMNALSAPMMLGYLAYNPVIYFDSTLKNILIVFGLLIFAAVFVTFFVNYYWYRLNKKYTSVILKSFVNFIPLLVLIEAYIFLGDQFKLKYLFVFLILTFSLFLCQKFPFKQKFFAFYHIFFAKRY